MNKQSKERGQKVTDPSNHHGEMNHTGHGISEASLKKYGRNLARAMNQAASNKSKTGRG